jgi:putative protease
MPLKRKKVVRKKGRVKRRPLKRRGVKKRAVKKKPLKRRPAKKAVVVKKAREGNIIGIVTHYFPKVRAAVIKLKGPLSLGDTVKIKGHTTDFTQAVTSMQIDHVPINNAKKGQEIGLLVDSRTRQHDTVYKV